jgi:opacity protein-like surface antigen
MLEAVHTNLFSPSARSAALKIFSYPQAAGRLPHLSTQPSGFGHNPTSPLGWAAGLGVEYLFTDAISAKIEYLYVDLGRVSCPSATTTPAGVIVPASALCNTDNLGSGSVSFTENLVRAGINYKFSW